VHINDNDDLKIRTKVTVFPVFFIRFEKYIPNNIFQKNAKRNHT